MGVNYYPFGWAMPGRKSNTGEMRFGFNGKENDQEWGSQVIQDYGFRIYNPSIAKFLSVDPLTKNYPFYTPYQFAGNRPIDGIDLDGKEYDDAKLEVKMDSDETRIEIQGELNIKVVVINLSSKSPSQSAMDFHDELSSKTFDINTYTSRYGIVSRNPETGKVWGDNINSKKMLIGTSKLDIEFEFSYTCNNLCDLVKGDIALLLVDEIPNKNDEADTYGAAVNGGNVYMVEVDVFNKKTTTDTHEKGHIVGTLSDRPTTEQGGKPRHLMSYVGPSGTKLYRSDITDLLESIIDQKIYEKLGTGKKVEDTENQAKELLKDYKITVPDEK